MRLHVQYIRTQQAVVKSDQVIKLAGDLYLAAMDAINPINPSALFMIKGADQTIYTTNGGQGFVTDQQLISAAQCSNPNAFFRSLLAKSYSTQVWHHCA